MNDTEQLWARYKTKGDLQARERLILDYSKLAKYVVDRIPLRPSATLGYEDLLGYGIIGLIDAVEKFDCNRGVKFETYAVSRIRGSVLDALKSLDWAPRSVRASKAELKRTLAALEAELGRPATDVEAAEAMSISVDELSDLLAEMGQSAILSLEDLLLYAGENIIPADRTFDPIAAAELEERKELLARAIGDLPEREKLVVSLYYHEGLTLKEIAQVLEVTESRTCQLHSKAVARLHGKLARHSELMLAAA